MDGAQCLTCKFFKSGPSCKFFEDGIPADIMSGWELHKEYRHYKTGKKWGEVPAEDK